MQILFNYDKKKVIQALRYHFISRPEIKIFAVITIVFSVLAGVFLFMKKIHPQIFLLASFIWMAFFIVVFYLLPLVIYKKSKHTFHDSFAAGFTPQYISIENARGRSEWEWNRFSNFFETPHFFHLYFNKRAFFLIPKDNMSSLQASEIRKLLTANVRIGKY